MKIFQGYKTTINSCEMRTIRLYKYLSLVNVNPINGKWWPLNAAWEAGGTVS